MTRSIWTVSMMRRNIMILSISALYAMIAAFSRMTITMMTLGIATFSRDSVWRHSIIAQQYDIQHNINLHYEIQHKNTQHNDMHHNDTHYNSTLPSITVKKGDTVYNKNVMQGCRYADRRGSIVTILAIALNLNKKPYLLVDSR